MTINKTALIITSFLFSFFANADFNTAKTKLNFVSTTIDQTEDGQSVNVSGWIQLSHPCRAFDQLKINKESVNDTIYYRIYGYDLSHKMCPTVMDPVEKEISIDQLNEVDLTNYSSININGTYLFLTQN